MSDERHILRNPDLHDGHLLAVELRGDDLRLRCLSYDGMQYEVTVPDLVRLRVDSFLEGNIIFELLLFVGSDCPEDLILSVYQGQAGDAWLPGALEEARRGRWSLLQLDSSYGCELLALGKGAVEVRPVETST